MCGLIHDNILYHYNIKMILVIFFFDTCYLKSIFVCLQSFLLHSTVSMFNLALIFLLPESPSCGQVHNLM